MAKMIEDSCIDVDPDTPIYRIFPVWFFEQAIQLKRLTLVSPARWEDPHETVMERIYAKTNGSEEISAIGESLPAVFGMSWSSTRDSDTLLRVYSRVVKDPVIKRNTVPREEGVRVRSTPRKLLTAMSRSAGSQRMNFVIGTVKYAPEHEIHQHMVNRFTSEGVENFRGTSTRTHFLLMKRAEFRSEAEIRLLAFNGTENSDGADMLHVPIDPEEVFDEVSFDPRLELFECCEREARIKSLGFRGEITRSYLYMETMLEFAKFDLEHDIS